MTYIGLQARIAQTPTVSPLLQQAVRLLQMSTLDYLQALQNAALDNPFLDVEPADAAGLPESEARAQDLSEVEFEWAQGLDRMARNEPSSTQRLSHDDSFDMIQQTPVRQSLKAHLHAQLGVLRLDASERFMAEAVIESLDDDGYLRISLGEIATAIGLKSNRGDVGEKLRMALSRVQAFEPLGVAARSVAECLSLQLREQADSDLRMRAQRIAAEHLELLATRKLQQLADRLGASEAQTQCAVDCILALDPRPGARYSDMQALAIVPDVVVRKVRGVWKTAFNADSLPRVRLHHSYVELFKQHRQAGDSAMKSYMDQARWTVQNATQRGSTILEIASVIVSRQKLFLDYGHMAMKPLGLREVADAVGVHPSTVSRAVHHKYLATPHGVFELHHFFSRGMEHTGGGSSAPVALQTLIRELIDAEQPSAPWSDAALARELAQQGFRIARRTVTKYRQGMNIDSFERRRVL